MEDEKVEEKEGRDDVVAAMKDSLGGHGVYNELCELCKIDLEGKARKVIWCPCVVVKDYEEDSQGLHIVHEYVKSHCLF
ncbi:hypothetical protein IEQ34_008466 [Dendrobium chrysotoxum]|uniref:Uncharacterized protein n=1 Tax=Dendrobium chrysotoxum TaxID=161865 RepID=A0AAV7GVZ7_DENCH|nr:hypothetical protein IEQ34_008466 [Dendrobium chrysotoxum]